jgi:hypothetical protein
MKRTQIMRVGTIEFIFATALLGIGKYLPAHDCVIFYILGFILTRQLI